jgi:multiple sugar transport system permease protein
VALLMSETLVEATGTLPRGPGRQRQRDGLAALFMLGPNVALFTVFVGLPIIGAFALSFFAWNLNGTPTWVGLANYTAMVHDPLVSKSVKNTLYFVAMGVLPTVFIGLGLALLINFQFRGVTIVRSLYLVPAAVSLAASAVIWQYIYAPRFGLLSYIFNKVGIKPPSEGFLFTPGWALPSLDVVCIWTTLPIAILLYLAALQRIPQSVIEAATLDGAGWFRRVRYVIWPGVSDMTLLVAIVSLIAFTASGFDLVNILTKGQPIYGTETLIYYIYYVSVVNSQWGYGAALSALQFVIIVGIIVLLAGARRFLVRRP